VSPAPVSTPAPPAFPLLELARRFPELAQLACPPERALMLLATCNAFGALRVLRAELRVRNMYDFNNGPRGRGFMHGMGLTDALTPLLAKLAGVTTLDLSNMDLGNTGARLIACILRNPTTKIERLILTANSMGYVNPTDERFRQVPQLLDLHESDTPGAAERLQQVQQFLHEHETDTPESGMAALLDALLTNETVKEVHLELNFIKVEHLPRLLRLVRESRTLDVLKIGDGDYDNPIPQKSLLSELVTTISQSTLRGFGMGAWKLDQETYVAIIRGLRTNKTLQVLDISKAHFNERVLISALRYALEENTTLTTLHVHHILDTGALISYKRVEQSMPRPFTLDLGPI
jgi:hypothetical protein